MSLLPEAEDELDFAPFPLPLGWVVQSTLRSPCPFKQRGFSMMRTNFTRILRFSSCTILPSFIQSFYKILAFRSKDGDNFFSSRQVSAFYPRIGFNIFPKLAVETHRGMPFRIGCIDKGEASPHSTQGLFLVDDNE